MSKKFAVIGLGILGHSLAKKLSEHGAEVIAIDSDMDRVDEIKDHVTAAVCLNATNERALKAQDVKDVDVAIVCIGEAFEANILATVLLKKIGVKKVITRASSEVERQILREIGADDLIYPEEDLAGELAVRLTAKSLLDLIPLSSHLAAAKIKPPKSFVNHSLLELQLRSKYSINVIAIYEAGTEEDSEYIFPTPETEIKEGQTLLIIGTKDDVDKIVNLE